MFDISPIQIIIVLAIALLVFGPKRLPEMGRNLGRGIRDFRGGLTGEAAPESAPAAATPTPAAATIAASTPEPSIEEIVRESSGIESPETESRRPVRVA